MIRDLKFDDSLVSKVMYGSKRITLRYNPGEVIVRGASLRLLDSEGECFAVARVRRAWHTNIRKFTRNNPDGYPDHTPEELAEKMDRYYEDDISDITPLTAIEFEIKSVVEDYSFD